ASANLEKVKGNISTNEETAIATSVAVNKSAPVLQSKQKEIPPVAQIEKEKSTEDNLKLQQRDTSLVALSDKEKPINLQQKQQEIAKVITPEKERKPEVILSPKPREALVATSGKINQDVIPQTKQKQIENTPPAVSIQPQLKLSPQEKQIAIVSKTV